MDSQANRPRETGSYWKNGCYLEKWQVEQIWCSSYDPRKPSQGHSCWWHHPQSVGFGLATALASSSSDHRYRRSYLRLYMLPLEEMMPTRGCPGSWNSVSPKITTSSLRITGNRVRAQESLNNILASASHRLPLLTSNPTQFEKPCSWSRRGGMTSHQSSLSSGWLTVWRWGQRWHSNTCLVCKWTLQPSFHSLSHSPAHHCFLQSKHLRPPGPSSCSLSQFHCGRDWIKPLREKQRTTKLCSW